jgi:ComF family protein
MAAQYIDAMKWHLSSQCEVCRRWSGQRLCGDCAGRHAAAVPRCTRCALRLPAAALCGECLRDPPPFSRTTCVADYGFPWDRLIADFKFQGRAELAPALAALMGDAIADTERHTLVLPVPLARQRLAERGYNQAWELARRVARRHRLEARHDLLIRALEGLHQAELTRAERLANLRAAFVVEPRLRNQLQGRPVALVDDVLTTGATAREAARVLLQAGAATVEVWVFARTP